MEYLKMNSEEKFLASFNNEPNGYAKVISVNGNVVLGYIGRFGYSVFEIGKNGYFSNVIEFGSIEVAKKEFNERLDQTGMIDLNEKIDLIKNEDVKSFLKNRISGLKGEVKSLEKWQAIQANCILGNLARKTVKQIESIALNNMQIMAADIVYNNRFLNIV